MNLRHTLALLTTLSLFLAAAPALADTNEACGKFDFSSGLNCKIEVEGGCTAQCTPLSFEGGCTGGCTSTATTSCTDNCGEACLVECNPDLLDCFQGCHDECDAEVLALCQAKNDPEVDCQEQAQAQCNMHCNDSCKVPPSSCQDHCISCCNGGCKTQVNFDCDYTCFAELKGGCDVQCTQPTGGLFCNGQFVYASDMQQCITWLATQGIEVDVSASATLRCGADGCDLGSAVEGLGCSATGASGEPEILFLLSLVGLMAVLRPRRRRRRR